MTDLKINDIVYVNGDYFDEDITNRWSENVAKIDYKNQSLLGLVKSFSTKQNKKYVNVLWFVDFNEQIVLLHDVKKVPDNFKPVNGVINNFNIALADYVTENNKNRTRKVSKNKNINKINSKKSNMTKREIRLSGERVIIINNYENQNISELYKSFS